MRAALDRFLASCSSSAPVVQQVELHVAPAPQKLPVPLVRPARVLPPARCNSSPAGQHARRHVASKLRHTHSCYQRLGSLLGSCSHGRGLQDRRCQSRGGDHLVRLAHAHAGGQKGSPATAVQAYLSRCPRSLCTPCPQPAVHETGGQKPLRGQTPSRTASASNTLAHRLCVNAAARAGSQVVEEDAADAAVLAARRQVEVCVAGRLALLI